ncbi:putative bifunctional diguanylate cyclase/phosphodiesterase [Pengzhenrongella sicca]|uniref:EAL domain-containing protein n=1 Tax=Pengzhenrongella sicca TaxID=2819238 RepID=A0A8A4ZIY1_9MICO|nr:EAL domain-containing protein [Pengzhenrongella sicca]QTE30983.1 EAL domain-containing protein [Pengzhenrongella sicca]
MPDEDDLSLLLSEFARTMVTDFPIQAILDHLVVRIVDVLPITAAGVSLIESGVAPRFVAASNSDALRFEMLQTDLGEGPCLSAFYSGEPSFVPDLAAQTKFPKFGPAALKEGMAAVFAFPLRHDDGRLGALDLYRDVAGPLSDRAQVVAQTLADVGAAYILNARARDDITQAADWFRERSLHDPLTGLPNRVLLIEHLEQASARARRTHRSAAILFVDLDKFKRVNDTHGHTVGDSLLIAVARRLESLVRPGDTVARVSGDEYVYLCEDLTSPADVDVLVDRVTNAFATPFSLPTMELSVTASIGIAYSGPGEEITDHLIIDADTAMYQAKGRGGATHQVLDLRAANEASYQNELERDLRTALDDSALDLAYQPIVRTSDGRLQGVEALLRWTHPTRGRIPALVAIATAEKGGFITELGEWVFERSCRDWNRWSADHPDRRLDLSVNVSARQLMNPEFLPTVERALRSTGMDPAAFVVEVTETVLGEDHDRVLAILRDLKTLGARLALDDFGTGYCSLTHLRRFPIDIVKIDRCFVSAIGTDAASTAVVESVAHLAHALEMSVSAEGVETERQRDGLVEVGCDSAQGYYFSRPLTTGALEAHLA